MGKGSGVWYNPSMVNQSRKRWILTGLVAVHVVLHGVALPMVMTPIRRGGNLSDVLLYALFMLGPSQATLLALWAMLGGGRFLWRVLPTTLGMILYMGCFQRTDSEWRIMIFGQMCVWGAIFFAARVAGLRLMQASALPSNPKPFQFSIRDMLMWTTALAVVLSALRCLPTDWFPSRPMPGIIFLRKFCSCCGCRPVLSAQ